MRPLSQTGAVRLARFPGIPTVIEGGFPGFETYAWWGVFAPAGTPKPMVERFGADFIASIREERVEKQVTEVQLITPTLGGPEVLRKFLAEQMHLWAAVIRENNIKGDA
jgi:tripartite-type tricarboxylate transporter receptor subunit TctC